MKLRELIEQLTEMADSEGCADAEVMVATQPNYPLAGVVAEMTLDMTKADKPVFWLAVGSVPYGEDPYAPRHAWDGSVVEAEHDD